MRIILLKLVREPEGDDGQTALVELCVVFVEVWACERVGKSLSDAFGCAERFVDVAENLGWGWVSCRARRGETWGCEDVGCVGCGVWCMDLR
jgi:hypothetical protein